MINYINVHTHLIPLHPDEIAILDISGKEAVDVPKQCYSSYGIHPWFLTPENKQSQMEKLEFLAQKNAIIAIGEVGFDTLRGAAPDLQKSVFEKVVSLSESLQKPLIIHCVRAWEMLFQIEKNMKPKQPWIIHGFGGSKELALQLLDHEFYISFGHALTTHKNLQNIFAELPINRLFLETDDNPITIQTLYHCASSIRKVDLKNLANELNHNFTTIFSLPLLSYKKKSRIVLKPF